MTAEERALAAINAAEAMAIQNVQLIKSLKSMFPKQFQPLIGIAPDLAAQQFGIVAETQRQIVKKVSRTKKQRANDKRKSEAWALANAKGRKKNGEYYAGWDQRRIAEYANKVLKKL